MSAFLCKYNTAVHIYIPIVKRGVVDYAVGADWTPAAGDVKISKDGGAAANVTNLPTAITMGNGAMWDFSLTSTELSAAKIVVTVVDSATKAVEDQCFIVFTFGNASAQYQVDFSDSAAFGLSRIDAAVTSRLAPTVAARTLDVSATGEAGVDWANVGSPTTSVGLTGTTIATSQVVASVSGAVGSVTGAVGSVTGNVGGNVVGSVASVTAAVATTSNVKKNQALSNYQFLMTDSTNHAPVTGKTVTVTRAIDNGSFASGTLSSVTEISNGIYRVDFAAADLNGNVVTLRATASGCDDTFMQIVTQP